MKKLFEIGRGILFSQEKMLRSFASRIAIISDHHVASLYGHRLQKILYDVGLQPYLFTFPPGEKYKTRSTKEMIENQMFDKGLGRDTLLLALGGGVVTDVGGFLAATFARGIPLILMPTSLLAMVDASIGGKNGVNLPYGKNLIGTIYPPHKVVIDLATLVTLPKQELSYGCVEMIKLALVVSQDLFIQLENRSEITEASITTSCTLKQEIVIEDEREQGKRRLLNFGHTLGHALEQLSDYALPHGEAVAIGILVESYLSMQMKILPASSFARIEAILRKYELPLTLPAHFSIPTLLDALILDKKSLQGSPRFVIIEEIGKALPFDGDYCGHVEKKMVQDSLEWMNDALPRY